MNYKLTFLPEAIEDLKNIDPSIRPQILKGIKKVLQNPEAKSLGGFGEPLSNKTHSHLAGLYKIKFRLYPSSTFLLLILSTSKIYYNTKKVQ